MIRLFAAVAVPEDLARDLSTRQHGLPGARWRPPEALHVTLRFFGETTRTSAAALDAELAAVVAEPFDLVLDGVGAFGEGGEVRAVWAGVEDNAALNRLAARCERAAREAGFEREARAYKPHVTLAYCRASPRERVAAWIQDHALLRSPPFRVTWFGLYSSWLSQEGSRYELEREYPLQ